MDRYAIAFRIKPESQDDVRRILANYGRPTLTLEDGTRLLGTAVFVKGDLVLRVVDIDGDLLSAVQGLARDPVIQEVERALNPHLVEPRDLDDPTSVRRFIDKARMELITHRDTDPSKGEF